MTILRPAKSPFAAALLAVLSCLAGLGNDARAQDALDRAMGGERPPAAPDRGPPRAPEPAPEREPAPAAPPREPAAQAPAAPRERPPATTGGPLTIEEGFRRLEQGDPRGADEAFRAELAREPRSLGAHEGLVWAWLALGDPAEAARWADARAALAPDPAWETKRLLVLSEVPARREEAIAGYRARVAAEPRDLDAWLQLAQLLSWTGRLPEAVEAYREAVAIAPRERAPRLGLARALAWSGQSDEAAKRFDEMLVDDPLDPDALYGRAQLARWAGDRGLASSLVERGLAERPADARLLSERARLALASGRRGDARQAADRALAADASIPEVREAHEEVERALAPRARLRATWSDESTPFARYALSALGELYPLADTRLRLELTGTHFRDKDTRAELERLTLGFELLQGLPLELYVRGSAHAHLLEEAAATFELAGELGWAPIDLPILVRGGARQRAIVDTPIGYEDVAFLAGVGSGGTIVAAIEERRQVREGYGAVTLSPLPGMYVYGDLTVGRIDDGNRRMTFAAGLGANVLQFTSIRKHALTLKYDYFLLRVRDEDPTYFSPDDFQVHSPGVEWRLYPWDGAVFGIEAGLALRSGESAGYRAGAFGRIELGERLAVEARFQGFDDTEFRILAATLGLSIRL